MGISQKIEPWMYRNKNENVVLFLTLVVLMLIGWIFFELNFYIFFGGVLAAIAWVKIQQIQYLGSAVKVYSKQFPKIFEVFKEHATKLQIPSASLYIIQSPELGAFSTGINKCTVVLNSALVEQFSDKELSFVIGHELGHFQAGHTKLTSIFYPLGNTGGGVVGFFSNIILGFWNRLSEYSCDNCGLALTKDVDSAITAIIKLTIGNMLYEKMSVEAYIKQIKQSQSKSVRISEALGLSSHPLAANRITNLVSFWKENFVKSEKDNK